MPKAKKSQAKKSKASDNSSSKSKIIAHDQITMSGAGGETHQLANAKTARLTTQQGAPVSDDQNSLSIGARGPTLLEDQSSAQHKIFHFDHERIPERVVHARGFGAHGYFENLRIALGYNFGRYFPARRGKTPAFVRFSTVAGNKGSPDLARDVRGFAVKLY